MLAKRNLGGAERNSYFKYWPLCASHMHPTIRPHGTQTNAKHTRHTNCYVRLLALIARSTRLCCTHEGAARSGVFHAQAMGTAFVCRARALGICFARAGRPAFGEPAPVVLPSLCVFPRFVGEVVPARALSPGSAGLVSHARDPHAVLELGGTANALVPLVSPEHLCRKVAGTRCPSA